MTELLTGMGPYATIASVVIALALGFVTAVAWLMKFSGWPVRIEHLEQQVAKLEGGNAMAREAIGKALAANPKEQGDVAEFLLGALKALA